MKRALLVVFLVVLLTLSAVAIATAATVTGGTQAHFDQSQYSTAGSFAGITATISSISSGWHADRVFFGSAEGGHCNHGQSTQASNSDSSY